MSLFYFVWNDLSKKLYLCNTLYESQCVLYNFENELYMKKSILFLLIICFVGGCLCAQNNPVNRERKKNLVVKEWNTRVGSSTPYLDNVVTYDEYGRKIEEIEYASYGQKKRITYSYEGSSNKCKEQVEYDDKNKPVRIKQFEYNEDGTRKIQKNYKPNGKLESTKTFEYIYK